MKTFMKPIALLGLAGALSVGALASSANAGYYVDGAYDYENAPAARAVAPAYAAAPVQRHGHESYAYAPGAFNAHQSFGAPVRSDGVRATEERHLNGTE